MPPKRKTVVGKGVLSDAYNRFREWFFPPNQLSASAYATFNQYKDKKVTDITIRRAPIIPAVDKVLNFISLGKLNEAKRESGYDKLFHLGMIITVEGGKKLLVEKNERINISTSWSSGSQIEYFPAPFQAEFTLGELLGKTEKIMGTFKFYQYNALENNCQDIILSILKAAGAASPEAIKFVKQEMNIILSKSPWYMKKFVQFATDTAAKIDQIIGGRGRRKRVVLAIKKTPAKKKTVTKKKRIVKTKIRLQ